MTETPAAESGPREVRTALALLLLATLSVGISGTMVRLSETGPVATAFWRMALATPVMWGLWRRERHLRPAARPKTAQDYALLVACGVLFGAEMAVWHVSLMMTSVTNATLLSNASPIIVALGGWLVLRERLTPTFVLGLAIALGGCAILVGQSFSIAMENVWGDALAAFAAVLFGVYILCVAKLRRRLSTPLIMTWTCAWGAVVLLPTTLLMGETFWPATPAGWATVGTIALACQVAGQTLLTAALAHLPAAFSSVAFLLVPVNAAWIAWAALGEPIRPLQVMGAVVIFAGVWLARRGSR